jgi:glutathione S-transferase
MSIRKEFRGGLGRQELSAVVPESNEAALSRLGIYELTAAESYHSMMADIETSIGIAEAIFGITDSSPLVFTCFPETWSTIRLNVTQLRALQHVISSKALIPAGDPRSRGLYARINRLVVAVNQLKEKHYWFNGPDVSIADLAAVTAEQRLQLDHERQRRQLITSVEDATSYIYRRDLGFTVEQRSAFLGQMRRAVEILRDNYEQLPHAAEMAERLELARLFFVEEQKGFNPNLAKAQFVQIFRSFPELERATNLRTEDRPTPEGIESVKEEIKLLGRVVRSVLKNKPTKPLEDSKDHGELLDAYVSYLAATYPIVNYYHSLLVKMGAKVAEPFVSAADTFEKVISYLGEFIAECSTDLHANQMHVGISSMEAELTHPLGKNVPWGFEYDYKGPTWG